MHRVVVVGAGLAGLRAGQELRSRGFDGDLQIIGDEKHLPYNRPPLSKQVLAGAMTPNECLFPLNGLNATWRLGQHGRRSRHRRPDDPPKDGDTIPFDGLVIATGRRARPWPGLPEMAGFHQLRGLDDAIALRDAVAARPRAVIIGAALSGARSPPRCACGASKRSLSSMSRRIPCQLWDQNWVPGPSGCIPSTVSACT